MRKENRIMLHNSVVGSSNLKTMVSVARRIGFDGIEPAKGQLENYLKAGYTTQDISALTEGLEISSAGVICDIDRRGNDFTEMMKEAEELFRLASEIGSNAVEVINGPVDWHAVDCYRKGIPYKGYMGLLGLDKKEQHDITVKNLRALADLADQYHIRLFFEPLCWTPVPSLKEGIPIVEEAGRSNLQVVVDFYHNYIDGVDAEFIRRIPKEVIMGVHICNAREPDENVPCEENYRDVGFYEGKVPIREWVQAVKETGFRGWWAYETFSKKELEKEPYEFAGYVYKELENLVKESDS